jgi:hypothetical protein
VPEATAADGLMGHEPHPARAELSIHVTRDGRVYVDVGSRYVEASLEEVDRALERLAAAGGSVAYSRDDPDQEPGGTATDVFGLAMEHRLPIRLVPETPEELLDDD